jgi:hypothetical protein
MIDLQRNASMEARASLKMQTRILVLAKARTGSTAFMELLNSHPEIGVKGELLNDNMRDLDIAAGADPDAVYAFIDKQLSAVVKPVAAFKVQSRAS